MSSVKIIPLPVIDDLGLESLGCDIIITDDNATVADLLTALDEFAGQDVYKRQQESHGLSAGRHDLY